MKDISVLGTFGVDLSASLEKYYNAVETLAALAKVNNDGKAITYMMEEYEGHINRRRGFILGQLKALVDTCPKQVADQLRMGGVPIDLAIKMRIDELVREPREQQRAPEFTGETSYWGKYRRLSELICGFGYNMTFIEERFKQFFPSGIHWTVLGFAEGYSAAFHAIAAENGIHTEKTDPKAQDVWKNWQFFLQPDCREYRLDGRYLYMYHGGFNCTSDRSIPYGDNQALVNEGVYARLQARSPASFKKWEKVNIDF